MSFEKYFYFKGFVREKGKNIRTYTTYFLSMKEHYLF